MDDQGLRLSSSSFLCLSRRGKRKGTLSYRGGCHQSEPCHSGCEPRHSGCEAAWKYEQAQGAQSVGWDRTQVVNTQEQSQETSIHVLSILCIDSRSQGKKLYSADPCFVYKHVICSTICSCDASLSSQAAMGSGRQTTDTLKTILYPHSHSVFHFQQIIQ